MMMIRAIAFALLMAVAAPGGRSLAQPTIARPIFHFYADEFWLNLHHFLYVLGRAEAKMGDATRDAVAGAPADAERGTAREEALSATVARAGS